MSGSTMPPAADGSRPHASTPSSTGERPELWGKLRGRDEALPLRSHLLDTAACASALFDTWLRPALRAQLADAIAGGDEAEARARIALVAGLHDLGKATAVFQGQMLGRGDDAASAYLARLIDAGFSEFRPGGWDTAVVEVVRRHEAATLALLAEGGRWPGGGQEIGADWGAAAAGGHHGIYLTRDALAQDDDGIARVFRKLASGRWGEEHAALVAEIEAATSATRADLATSLEDRTGTVTLLATGLTMAADWIASEHPCPIDDAYASRERAYADLLPRTIGLPIALTDARERLLGAFASTPRHVQLAAEADHADLAIICETTGSGKTEAALLRHARFGELGLMFALPTRATANAMWRRLLGAYRGLGVASALLHQYRSLDAFYAGGASGPTASPYRTDWLDSAHHALFAPLTVGTIDQVLVGALKRRRLAMRLLALANRHIVLDEVHTLDPYQRELLLRMLSWWGRTGTPVTMLSATLPAAAQRAFLDAYARGRDGAPTRNDDIEQGSSSPPYPGIVSLTPEGRRDRAIATARRYELALLVREVEAGSIVDAALERAAAIRRERQGACIGVVVNRVDAAIAIGARLLAQGEPVLVLHSRMTAAHRERAARELELRLGRGGERGAITVVGTQVIEASLDVDFDALISELAPAPSLIQRAGRLWRHSTPSEVGWNHVHMGDAARWRGEAPTLEVVARVLDGHVDPDCLPYPVWEMERTLAALRASPGALAVPDGVQTFVDDAYFDLAALDAYETRGDAPAAIAASATAGIQRVRAAATFAVPFGTSRDTTRDSRMCHGDLAALTDAPVVGDWEETHGTRFVELEQASVMLCGDEDAASSAEWRGDPLRALASRDERIVRQVLERIIPVSAAALRSRLQEIPVPEEAPRGSHQRSLRIARLGASARYDEVLGLRFDGGRVGSE